MTVETVTYRLEGTVQGVGFRPFVYRVAKALGVRGWVRNDAQGVTICATASPDVLRRFEETLQSEAPSAATIVSFRRIPTTPLEFSPDAIAFRILESDATESIGAFISPDLAVCTDCLRELHDPTNRRYRYPFINCTNCGPRFTIVEALPYDRPNTTMRRFVMCDACRAEYENPLDRRFHAQPNACPACGPHLELWDPHGTLLADREDALAQAVDAVRKGLVLAVKGLGGFHLVVDARNEEAVRLLRRRKRREEKPLALMAPSLSAVEIMGFLSERERCLLTSPTAPILLLRRRPEANVAPSVAPGNPYLGVMLPYTPLHHLLMESLGFPVVATSGNLSEEPICIDEHEAIRRLGGDEPIADLFLVHNRPIARHADDSVVRVVLGEEMVLRAARGYAPYSMAVETPFPTILAVGPHLKNTVAISSGKRVFVSQHVGNLETAEAFAVFRRVVDDFRELYALEPLLVVRDLHPDYLSSQFAENSGLSTQGVQHHAAHVFACMAERRVEPPLLGVSWDGTGFGPDGTVWGGEFLRINSEGSWERAAHLRTFPLPGGETAVKEPRRSALGVLAEVFGDAAYTMRTLPTLRAFREEELSVLRQALARRLNTPLTSSVGRLFDAIASLVGLRQRAAYEGQAAMELEWRLAGVDERSVYPLPLVDSVLDWEPLIRALLEDFRRGVSVGVLSARFHNALVEGILAVAERVGEPRVVLTGGCFQNVTLLEGAVRRLRERGFDVEWPRRVPPNDGGIALGQIFGAVRQSKSRTSDAEESPPEDSKTPPQRTRRQRPQKQTESPDDTPESLRIEGHRTSPPS